MRKLVWLFTLLSCFTYAQNELDIYRLSKTRLYGDARFEAMAGSFGALGANPTCMLINPAGIGRYSSDVFTSAFGFENRTNQMNFVGNTTDNAASLFHLNNLSLIFSEDISKETKGFLYTQLGIGFNRVQGFRNNYSYSGNDGSSSFLSFMADQAAGVSPENLYLFYPFTSSLAWETYAMNYKDTSGTYYPLWGGQPVQQNRGWTERGGINELTFNLSTNYLNKLYLGANIGIPFVSYKYQLNHIESISINNPQLLDSIDYQYNLDISGSGINVKLGAIYLPTPSTRIGFAIHTPTFWEMEDDYSATMTSYFQDTTFQLAEVLKPKGNYAYRLNTPFRLVASAAYIWGNRGCINTDIQYITYRGGRLKPTNEQGYTPYNYAAENDYARSVLVNGLNWRTGGEYVFAGIFFLRGGFGLFSPAFSEEYNLERSWDQLYSGGVGLKIRSITFDVSYSVETLKRMAYSFGGSSTEVEERYERMGFTFTYSF